MHFSNPYWSNMTKMELLEKWIIVHSIIYYELNGNVVKDSVFDYNAKQLVYMIATDITSFEQTRWFYAMKDFDGNTGFDLYTRLNMDDREALTLIARNILYYHKRKEAD